MSNVSFLRKTYLPHSHLNQSVHTFACLSVWASQRPFPQLWSQFPVFPLRAHPLWVPSRLEEIHSTAQHYSECMSHLKAISLAHSPGHSDFLSGGNYLLGSWEREAFSYPPQDWVRKMGSWRFQGQLHRALGGASTEQNQRGILHTSPESWLRSHLKQLYLWPSQWQKPMNSFALFLYFKLSCLGPAVIHNKKIPNPCIFHQANMSEDIGLISPPSSKYW